MPPHLFWKSPQIRFFVQNVQSRDFTGIASSGFPEHAFKCTARCNTPTLVVDCILFASIHQSSEAKNTDTAVATSFQREQANSSSGDKSTAAAARLHNKTFQHNGETKAQRKASAHFFPAEFGGGCSTTSRAAAAAPATSAARAAA